MSKSVLTLEEYNLLVNSEEAKNKDAYGNLYEVLTSLKVNKSLSLEDMPGLDKVALGAVLYNKNTLKKNAVAEWTAEYATDLDPNQEVRCALCNTKNMHIYYITNLLNGNELNVGSQCIKNFSDMRNFKKANEQRKNVDKERKKAIRRTDFHEHFPDCLDVINDARGYFNNLPILLPFSLYINLKETPRKLREIYDSYIQHGKTPYKSDLSPFELFDTKVKEYESLKIRADEIVKNNRDKEFICKKRELEWMISSRKEELLETIAKNNGFYTLDTLKQMSSSEFVSDSLENILSCANFNYFSYKGLEDNKLVFLFDKKGYESGLEFNISLKNFMHKIGAYCLYNTNYFYRDNNILDAGQISFDATSYYTILNKIHGFLKREGCALLLDEITEQVYLYRISDKAIRKFNYKNILEMFAKNILSDEKLEGFTSSLMNNKTARWNSKNEQSKQGIDDKIQKLYGEYKQLYDV